MSGPGGQIGQARHLALSAVQPYWLAESAAHCWPEGQAGGAGTGACVMFWQAAVLAMVATASAMAAAARAAVRWFMIC
jgi:hypothetical protein